MKRRSFLKSVFGGLTVLFLPKSKATDISKKDIKPIVWRKFNPPEKSPEAYTQEDIDAACGFNEKMLGDKPWMDAQDAAYMEGDQWTDEQKRILVDLKEDELVYKFLETQLKNTPIRSISSGIQYINGIKYNYFCFGIGFANAINREKEKNYRIWECEDGEYVHYSILDMRMHSVK